MSDKITLEDRQRVELLRKISKSRHGFKQLTLPELKRLQELVEKKVKLLSKINVRIYELEEGEGIFK